MCICPVCNDTSKPVCAKDDVQDKNPCEVQRQSCLTGDMVEVAKEAPCGGFVFSLSRSVFVVLILFSYFPLRMSKYSTIDAFPRQ